ncbi:WG repeat-containing protein [Ruegeria sp. HKCCD8929]|uniref:WG repeat-containing protein n=1 Tax=Ruegeria sp. HKCCD8929 TaxID=2683006 RepID=UPI001489133C|nr:WG repeat-containing protein [Ruegeria sp. HKCCD8929]
MRSRVQTILTLLTVLTGSIAQSADLPKPACGGVFGLCGYVDPDGDTQIPYKFEKARAFRYGLAAVRVEGLWGFIDPSGKIVVLPQFKAVGDFQEARAEAAIGEGVGVIDRKGQYVIPPRFDRAIPFARDAALVVERDDSTEPWAAQRLHGDFLFDSFRFYRHRDGRLSEGSHKFQWFRRPADGNASLIWASPTASGSVYGLMDAQGAWVVEPRFRHVQALHDGLAVVRDTKWGAVNEEGHIAIPLQHEWLSYFENGYAVIGGPEPYQSRKSGLIRSDGTVVAEPIYDKADRPGESGGLPRVKRDGLWYWIENGELIPDGAPDGSVVASCPQGLKVVRQGASFIVTDIEGNPALPEPVGHVAFGVANDNGAISGAALSSHDLDCQAPIVVVLGDVNERNTRSTYVRPNGRLLFEPSRFFKSANRFHMGHAVVQTDGLGEQEKWGIIDVNGQFTLALGINRVRPNGRISKIAGAPVFALERDDSMSLINEYGLPLTDVESAIEDKQRKSALSCLGGSTIIHEGDRFGIARENGEILVPAIHRAISCYRNGVAWAPKEDAGKWCPIGPNGRFRSVPACIQAFYPMRVSHHYPEQFADDPFENSVLWLRAGLRYGLGLRETPPRWIGDGVQSRASYSVFPFFP